VRSAIISITSITSFIALTSRDLASHRVVTGVDDSLRNAVFFLELLQLFGRQEAPLTRSQPLARHPSERLTSETHDREARGLSHPANLLVSAFEEGDLDPGLSVLVTNQTRLTREGLPVVELDPLAPAQKVGLGHLALHLRDVELGHLGARVQQAL
jgi:hypothetical protein